jgi:hypothetical protein
LTAGAVAPIRDSVPRRLRKGSAARGPEPEFVRKRSVAWSKAKPWWEAGDLSCGDQVAQQDPRHCPAQCHDRGVAVLRADDRDRRHEQRGVVGSVVGKRRDRLVVGAQAGQGTPVALAPVVLMIRAASLPNPLARMRCAALVISNCAAPVRNGGRGMRSRTMRTVAGVPSLRRPAGSQRSARGDLPARYARKVTTSERTLRGTAPEATQCPGMTAPLSLHTLDDLLPCNDLGGAMRVTDGQSRSPCQERAKRGPKARP